MRQGVVLPLRDMPDLHYLDPYPSEQPAVVLLHGLGADSSSWVLQFEPLIGAGFRPIAPDITGFGASPYDGKGWSVDQAAKRIADLLAQLNAVPAHVVGLSMGGVIAQQMALDFPRLARQLVLVSTFSYLRPDSLRGWLYFARRAILILTRGVRAQARMVAWDLFPDPAQEPIREILIEQICRSDPRVYRKAMRALGRYNSSRRLHEIQVPTLVVTGGRDTTVSSRNQERLAQLIPGAEQVIIPDAGHAVTVDQADIFNRTLLDFLQRS
jgi:pimeloyl-ACP methyl ester carboxylesterase